MVHHRSRDQRARSRWYQLNVFSEKKISTGDFQDNSVIGTDKICYTKLANVLVVTASTSVFVIETSFKTNHSIVCTF